MNTTFLPQSAFGHSLSRRGLLRSLSLAGCAAVLPSCAGMRPVEARRAIRVDLAALKAKAATFDLVDVTDVDPTILIDLRYAGSNNITGAPIYPQNMPCLLHRHTAHMLHRAQTRLRAAGATLRVWDGWRPPEAAQILYDRVGDSGFVHKPGKGGRWSWHCYGRAVDVTLSSLDGRPLAMPTDFDDFSDKAHYEYKGNDPAVELHLAWLQDSMDACGFELLDLEWWHFSDPPAAIPPQPVWARDLGLVLA